MFVKNWMSKDVITVDVEGSMPDAVQLMKQNDIRMRSIERPKLQKLKEELSRTAALIYLVDHRENSREIF